MKIHFIINLMIFILYCKYLYFLSIIGQKCYTKIWYCFRIVLVLCRKKNVLLLWRMHVKLYKCHVRERDWCIASIWVLCCSEPVMQPECSRSVKKAAEFSWSSGSLFGTGRKRQITQRAVFPLILLGRTRQETSDIAMQNVGPAG
jgi:hypothetical protein